MLPKHINKERNMSLSKRCQVSKHNWESGYYMTDSRDSEKAELKTQRKLLRVRKKRNQRRKVHLKRRNVIPKLNRNSHLKSQLSLKYSPAVKTRISLLNRKVNLKLLRNWSRLTALWKIQIENKNERLLSSIVKLFLLAAMLMATTRTQKIALH